MILPFRFLLLATFFNTIEWITFIPVWQYPDEQAHFAQIQDVAELGKRPVDKLNTSLEIALSEKILGTERDWMGNNKYTYHPEYRLDYSDTYFGPEENFIINLPKSTRSQLVKNEATLNPPLYPFLGSLFYRLFESGSLFVRVYAVRLMSLIFFMATIIVSYKIGQVIFVKSKILPLVLASLVAFMPMFVFASTGVLPDSLTNLFFSLIIFLSLKILTKGLNPLTLFFLFLVIIFGSLTRQHFLISIPIIVFPIIYQIFRKLNLVKKHLLLLIFFLLFLFIASFFIKYLEPLKTFSIFEIGQINLNKLLNNQFLQFFSWTLRHTYSEVLPWYWGVYKWLSLTIPHISYQIINRLILIAIGGIIIKLFQIIKKRKVERQDTTLFFMLYASIVYFLIFLIWDYFFSLQHGYSFGIQGRYFFPMITAHFTILTVGFWQIARLFFRKFAKYMLIIMVFLMMIFNNISLSYISASYYKTSSISTFVNQASQYKPSLIKGNIILLIILITLGAQGLFLFNLIKYAKKSAD